MSQCTLCSQKAQLLESHIIPEFMYQDMYDEKHRTLQVESGRADSPRTIQKGLRERLLCAPCETQISVYESYAAPIVKSLPTRERHPTDLLLLPLKVEYRRFKLFQMSLLWRASVSADTMFAGADLGQSEPRLREMLANQRPGLRHNYGCVLAMIPDTKYLHTIIGPPVRMLVHGFHCIRFQIGPLFWNYFLSTFPSGHPMSKALLTEEGRLVVLLPRWDEGEVISQIAAALRPDQGAA